MDENYLFSEYSWIACHEGSLKPDGFGRDPGVKLASWRVLFFNKKMERDNQPRSIFFVKNQFQKTQSFRKRAVLDDRARLVFRVFGSLTESGIMQSAVSLARFAQNRRDKGLGNPEISFQ